MKLSDIIKAMAFLSIMAVTINAVHAQGIYFDPAPTDVTQPARLYVDVSSAECGCPELQDGDPDANPLFIWAWLPNESRLPVNDEEVTNGEWTMSNPNLMMRQDSTNSNLWYYDFLGVSLVEFYDVSADILYNQGINFLVKEESGAPNAAGAEQKSPDLLIVPDPVGCFEKVCAFPTTWFQDEYFVITYDNKQEANPGLQNMQPDECLIWYRYSVNGGSLQILREESPKFTMEFDGDGIFSKTMIPQNYVGLQDGDQLDQIRVFITKTLITAPPFTQPVNFIPGCQ